MASYAATNTIIGIARCNTPAYGARKAAQTKTSALMGRHESAG